MSTIKEFLTTDHSRCDEIFASMEEAASDSLESAVEICKEFMDATEHHFQMEERVMFLEFETKTGMTQGPTQMMRHEHVQMRNLITQMGEAIDAGNKDKFFSLSETLMILLQQHNMKEEQMLYAMCDRVLPEEIKQETLQTMKNMSI